MFQSTQSADGDRLIEPSNEAGLADTESLLSSLYPSNQAELDEALEISRYMRYGSNAALCKDDGFSVEYKEEKSGKSPCGFEHPKSPEMEEQRRLLKKIGMTSAEFNEWRQNYAQGRYDRPVDDERAASASDMRAKEAEDEITQDVVDRSRYWFRPVEKPGLVTEKVPSDATGTIELSDGDKICRAGTVDVLVRDNGDVVVVNGQDGKIDFSSKHGGSLRYDPKTDSTTITFKNGDKAVVKNNRIVEMERFPKPKEDVFWHQLRKPELFDDVLGPGIKPYFSEAKPMPYHPTDSNEFMLRQLSKPTLGDALRYHSDINNFRDSEK